MGKPFRVLRARLLENDIDQDTLCGLLNRSKSYVSGRMMGRAPWSMSDMETIMRHIGEPWENVGKVFPPMWVKPVLAAAPALRLVK